MRHEGEIEELVREGFIDGWLQGLNMARRLLANAGGTFDAPVFGCINASKDAYNRAKERVRKRKYPKLKVAAIRGLGR